MMTSIFIKLNKLNREEYRIKAIVSGFLIIFILLLDLHRFGAWFLGYRTYIKSYWVPVMLFVGYPILKYALAGLIQFMADRKMFKTLHFVMFFIAALPFSFCNPECWQIFAWGGRPFYEKNIFHNGPEFYHGLAWIIPTTLIYMAVAWVVDRFNLL